MDMDGMRTLQAMSREELLDILLDDAKNWLAHDGLWFQAVEADHGMEDAIRADAEAWRHFTVLEAERIMKRLGMEPGGGIEALVECLKHRLYARVNRQSIVEQSEKKVVFRMEECRVQVARKRKGLPDFPCKSVALVEYTGFAETVDPRLRTRCVACPPDEHPEDYWCAWEFTLGGEPSEGGE